MLPTSLLVIHTVTVSVGTVLSRLGYISNMFLGTHPHSEEMDVDFGKQNFFFLTVKIELCRTRHFQAGIVLVGSFIDRSSFGRVSIIYHSLAFEYIIPYY